MEKLAFPALHFFPKSKQLIYLDKTGKVSHRIEAWGGVDGPAMHGMMRPQQTPSGRYVIYSYEPYRTDTWRYSRITWGTEIKISADNKYVLYKLPGDMYWAKLLDAPNGNPISPQEVLWLQRQYYGTDIFPKTWTFNDFGPYAVRFFVDVNHNNKLDRDKGEKLKGEMIHTTPRDEADTARGRRVALGNSHGCIHIKPVDRERFHRDGVFEKGNLLFIHTYDEDAPRN